MSFIAKQRRALVTIATIFCMIYSSHVTIQIFSGLAKRHDCKGGGGAVSRQLTTLERSEPASFDHDEDGQGQSEQHIAKNQLYRLDLLEADIARLSGELEEDVNNTKPDERTNYFNCADFDRIPRTRKEVEENLRGNRGISFIKVRINGVTIPTVMKEANRLYRTVVEEYKYNSAKREIFYLVKLRGLRGIPRLLGSCVEDLRIRYLVERVQGVTLCNDNGTTPACAAGNHIMSMIEADKNPELAALTFAYSTATFFQQLEERHLFMEDVSGLNFMVTKDWQLYMVDADSLVFYNDSRIYSMVSCSRDDDCPGPRGNLWVDKSLNQRIYSNCRDLTGICEDRECRGFGTELHACGLAHWYLCRLNTYLKTKAVASAYEEVCVCTREMFPHRRCTFRRAADIIRGAFSLYLKGNSKESILT